MQHTPNSGTSFELPSDLNELDKLRSLFAGHSKPIVPEREQQQTQTAQIFTLPTP